MFKAISMALTVMLAIGLTSCGDDDDNNNGPTPTDPKATFSLRILQNLEPQGRTPIYESAIEGNITTKSGETFEVKGSFKIRNDSIKGEKYHRFEEIIISSKDEKFGPYTFTLERIIDQERKPISLEASIFIDDKPINYMCNNNTGGESLKADRDITLETHGSTLSEFNCNNGVTEVSDWKPVDGYNGYLDFVKTTNLVDESGTTTLVQTYKLSPSGNIEALKLDLVISDNGNTYNLELRSFTP